MGDMIKLPEICLVSTSPGCAMKPKLSLGITSDQKCVGGSVPSSPESDCEGLAAGPGPECSTLDKDTQTHIYRLFVHFTGRSHDYSRQSKVVVTMVRVVGGLAEKHEVAYKGLISKLNLDERGDDMHVITTVAKEMFSDGVTNWGRIASLLSFGAMVCKYHSDRGQDHRVRLVAEEISSYLLSDKRDWLLTNKAWDGFVDFFHVSDPESKMRNALMTFVTVAGIGAGLAFLAR
ncbi:induced myeloid leukemia cell differentiation protein Mcl-1b [Brachyhypopomus gauderio]|uniref:induced myeloid leukemia cell differentiation protein Mcl-1b n=1 Tax=Brachyhypopomus gauderio TaxID=698409 RepID=UPI004041D9BF